MTLIKNKENSLQKSLPEYYKCYLLIRSRIASNSFIFL
jgi:hypothetical protein